MSRPNGVGAAKPPTSSTLTSLLAQANSLNHVDQDTELPQLRYGIEEIERMSESVAGKGKRRGRDGEGFNLLSNLGVNTSQLAHAVPSSTPRRRRRHAVEQYGAGPSTAGQEDMSVWGRNWHETIILSGIELQRQKTVKSFEKQFQARMLQNWENEKKRVLQEELGVTEEEVNRGNDLSKLSTFLGDSVLGKSSLGASTRRFPLASSTFKSTDAKEGGMAMHSKMMRYEQAVRQLNQSRSHKEPFELCQALAESTKGDQKFPALPSSYRILAFVAQEPSVRDALDAPAAGPSQSAEPVQERQYAEAYLGDARSSRAALLRGRLVIGGRRFLERDFENHVDEMIAKYPKEAALGGVPGIKKKIRAYVSVVLRSKEAQETYNPESVDGTYVFAIAYYLLRCGYPDEAASILADHQSSLRREDWSLPGAFRARASIPRSQRDTLLNDFNATVRNNPTVDQYKLALYKIVGRLELNRKTAKVAQTTEDWIWLQLMLVRDSRDDAPQDVYTFDDFARLVVKYGSERFDQGGQRPLVWFNVLVFSGQYERAISYLYSKPQLRTDAVHFAIALAYYGLLRTSSIPDADLLTESERPVLNFARMVRTYIQPFYKAEPTIALQYAYLVALGYDSPIDGVKQRDMAVDMVRDIVLASKSWSKLLGSVRADGSKETGVIERDLGLLRLSNTADYLHRIVLSAADQSSLDSSLIDSIELYHLAGSYNKVVESANRALGQTLGSDAQPLKSEAGAVGLSGAFGGANDVYSLAKRVHEVYERDLARRSKVSVEQWTTLEVLLQLKLALAQFAEGRPDLALDTLRSTNLLPLDPSPTAPPTSVYTARFKQLLDQPTIASLDDIVVTAMKCLHQLSQHLKTSPYGDQGRAQMLAGYRTMAMGLVQFASGLRLRLGGDVYRQLSSMSAFF
ncbi:Nup93/Nic96-domain-containing protein [Naematelia encephala]|uniref:Nuclear pore protein n=1 Tax=Naematelia encephala TaxID=71784 RepID=A0A1Y2ADV5_9TREE|nr:Nup93/Nic96-domain-containing protein [Naematelia encephala]